MLHSLWSYDGRPQQSLEWSKLLRAERVPKLPLPHKTFFRLVTKLCSMTSHGALLQKKVLLQQWLGGAESGSDYRIYVPVRMQAAVESMPPQSKRYGCGRKWIGGAGSKAEDCSQEKKIRCVNCGWGGVGNIFLQFRKRQAAYLHMRARLVCARFPDHAEER